MPSNQGEQSTIAPVDRLLNGGRLHLLDIGARGGLHPRWRRFAARSGFFLISGVIAITHESALEPSSDSSLQEPKRLQFGRQICKWTVSTHMALRWLKQQLTHSKSPQQHMLTTVRLDWPVFLRSGTWIAPMSHTQAEGLLPFSVRLPYRS